MNQLVAITFKGLVFKTLKERGIPKQNIAIGLLDEASPQNRANTVRLWSFEHSPVVRKNTTHFQTNTIGFYAIQGVSVQHFMADSKTESVVDFLHRVKAANATFKAIIIVLDNYSTHHASQVKATARELDGYVFSLFTVLFARSQSIRIHLEKYQADHVQKLYSDIG